LASWSRNMVERVYGFRFLASRRIAAGRTVCE